jgi:hypothetical protein
MGVRQTAQGLRGIGNLGWSETERSPFEEITQNRKSIYRASDVATDAEAEGRGCDCLIHTKSKFMHQKEDWSLSNKFGGEYK